MVPLVVPLMVPLLFELLSIFHKLLSKSVSYRVSVSSAVCGFRACSFSQKGSWVWENKGVGALTNLNVFVWADPAWWKNLAPWSPSWRPPR